MSGFLSRSQFPINQAKRAGFYYHWLVSLGQPTTTGTRHGRTEVTKSLIKGL